MSVLRERGAEMPCATRLPQSLRERGRGAARYLRLLRVLQLPTIAPGAGLPHPAPGLRRSGATCQFGAGEKRWRAPNTISTMRCKPGPDFLPYDRPIAVSKIGSTSRTRKLPCAFGRGDCAVRRKPGLDS